MSRLVVINLGSGNLLDGCSEVTAQISLAESDRHPIQCRGSLPPAPEIDQLYKTWQLLYREFYREPGSRSTRTIKIESEGVTHFSEIEFRDLSQRLKTLLNDWLNSESFLPIDRKLSRILNPADEIRVILETNDDLLRRLPWHLWNFFEDYPFSEVALSTLEYGKVNPKFQKKLAKVKILAILGNSKGIDIQADRQAIEALPGADPLFLESPHRQALNEHLWDKQGWDILFFAGHSQTEEETGTGRIHINSTDSLTLDQLRNALNRAISCGLKLAIFNSCDGLGLARDLADLHIPQVIVMREQIPDKVAQEFFRHFLEAFSGGQSLYMAVREARERLEKLEDEYPCATWLPVICQNPATEVTTWQEWCSCQLEKRPRKISKFPFKTVLPLSVATTLLIVGVRQLGILQGWELQTFDRFMQLRTQEGQDLRLLIVTVTEEDFQLEDQKLRQGSLSDKALGRVLEKLEQYQARAIGLDIYRDFPVSSTQKDKSTQINLSTYLQKSNNFFAICKASEVGKPGTAPPPEVPPERQGFSDIVKDSDGIVRRHLIAMQPDPTSPCTTPYALSAQLAFHYLEKEGISAEYTQTGLQLGNVVLKRLPEPNNKNSKNTFFNYLQTRRGGYQQVDAWGYQILLNYRSYRSPLDIAPTVTLKQVLKGQVKPEVVKDRIVLIGVTAASGASDFVSTPYSTEGKTHQQMPGVIAQAQMVSQILSAVLDGRPLLSVWTFWEEVLWIWGWSLMGGVIGWQSRFHWLLTGTVILLILCFFSFALFVVQGLWVPLVPSVLAFTFTGVCVVLCFPCLRQQQIYE
ncbi:CHASE2 domain-containing protein [Candidatus Gracilibacteria bacterium]|nr:CHASE2 domain-containing protein [Candidatus Gracilibacteria bacterium]